MELLLEDAPEWVKELCKDQQDRWKEGEYIAIETYIDRHALLQEDIQSLLTLVANEARLRQEQGETVPLEEYLHRLPRLSTVLDLENGIGQPAGGPTETSVSSRDGQECPSYVEETLCRPEGGHPARSTAATGAESVPATVPPYPPAQNFPPVPIPDGSADISQPGQPVENQMVDPTRPHGPEGIGQPAGTSTPSLAPRPPTGAEIVNMTRDSWDSLPIPAE